MARQVDKANKGVGRQAEGVRPRRWRRWVALAGVVGALAGAVVAAWPYLPKHSTVYTDADRIHLAVEDAALREILWQPPVLLSSGVNSSSDDFEPAVSADGNELYFVRRSVGGDADLFVAERAGESWLEPRALSALNTEDNELGPYPAPDGLAVYFYSDRPGGLGGYDLWRANRRDDGAWGAAVNVGPAVNSALDECGPAVAPDGATLYFASNRPRADEVAVGADDSQAGAGGTFERGDYDLYAATVRGGEVGDVRPLARLNTPANDVSPALSSAGDFLYFSSDRGGGAGGLDLYRARLLGGAFQAVEHLADGVNSPANELDPVLTMCGYALLFSSDRVPAGVEASAGAVGRRNYDLYRSVSREVFSKVETSRAAFDWGDLLGLLGPSLLWALVTLALLLAFLKIGDVGLQRKLSLMAKCLCLSLALHALLMLAFSLWDVTTSLTGAARRNSGVKVALALPVDGQVLAGQIRGGFAEQAPRPEAPALSEQARPVLRSAASVARFEPAPAPAESLPEGSLTRVIEPAAAPVAEVLPDAESMSALPPMSLAEQVALRNPPTVAGRRVDERAVAVDAPTQADSPRRDAFAVGATGAARPMAVDVARSDGRTRDEQESSLFQDTVKGVVEGRHVRVAAGRLSMPRPEEADSGELAIQLPSAPQRKSSGGEREDVIPPVAAGAAVPQAFAAREDMSVAARSFDLPGSEATRRVDTMPVRVSLSGTRGAAPEVKVGPAKRAEGRLPEAHAEALAVSLPTDAPVAGGGEETLRIEAPASASDGVAKRAPIDVDTWSSPQRTLELTSARRSSPVADELPSAVQREPVALVDEPKVALSVAAPRAPLLPQPDLQVENPAAFATQSAIVGIVVDQDTREPLEGARVRIDLGDGEAASALTDGAGGYELTVPETPEFFALSASREAYVPAAVNIPTVEVRGQTLRVNFLLRRETPDTVAIEAVPDVHHLGDNRFSGSVNSQFQKRSEGAAFAAEFVLSEQQVAPYYDAAEITLLARGVQMRHPVLINGRRLPERLRNSPRDGSFGEVRIAFDAGLLQAGVNTVQILARSRGDDIDDFEFVNVQIQLGR